MAAESKVNGFDAARYCRRHLAEGHNAHLGLRYIGSGDGWIELALPIRDDLRDCDGDLADAAVISLLDMAGTLSVWARSAMWRPLVTVDLRVDWTRDFSPKNELVGHAGCELIRDDIAYVTGHAHGPESRCLARFAATYLIIG